MEKTIKKILAISAFLFVPIFVQAAASLQSLILVLQYIAGLVASTLSMLAFVAFFYGLAIYILNSGNEEKEKEGRNIMTWGTVALFILVTIWGVIGLLQRTVGNTQGPGQIEVILPKF